MQNLNLAEVYPIGQSSLSSAQQGLIKQNFDRPTGTLADKLVLDNLGLRIMKQLWDVIQVSTAKPSGL
jgi:hypothetical protein